MLRVVCVSPTYFSPESLVGGGERYCEELARALAVRPGVAAVKLVSFGRRARREEPAPRCERAILKSWTSDPMTPFSPRLREEVAEADVVHCFQYFVLPTFLACLFGALGGARVFVSDLGGGAWTPGYQIDQSRWIAAHLPISRYAARTLPGRNRRHRVIYGGVDLARWPARPRPGHDGSAVFLGRILPHKGIHFLIEGLPADIHLRVIGPAPDPVYLARLRQLAAGKRVEFLHGLVDGEIVAYLHRAMALVHPTPVGPDGSAGAHELLGLAPLEAMACGCPVVASAVASLPEIVEHEADGLLVPPNDPEAIGRALLRLAGDSGLWARASAAARAKVEERFTWERVAGRCLEAYAA